MSSSLKLLKGGCIGDNIGHDYRTMKEDTGSNQVTRLWAYSKDEGCVLMVS